MVVWYVSPGCTTQHLPHRSFTFMESSFPFALESADAGNDDSTADAANKADIATIAASIRRGFNIYNYTARYIYHTILCQIRKFFPFICNILTASQ